MSIPVFLADAAALRADHVRLDGDEGRHAAVVRRIAPGEQVQLTDGRGHVAVCRVVDADRDGLTCEVESRYDVAAARPRLTVVQALPKGERAEAAVEAMTEVGVDEIVPWAAARCITKWKGERGDKALRKWRATAREAAKQSRRAWLPEVAGMAATSEIVARLRAAALAVVLHEEAQTPASAVAVPDGGEIILVVGPEGGISPDERSAFTAAGAVDVRLGPTVLRTSTAGAVAAGVVLSRTSRWAAG